MTKKKWWKKDVLWVEQQLKNFMNKNVCFCWNWKNSISHPNPFFPKSFYLYLKCCSVLDPEIVKSHLVSINISIWDAQQEPTFEVLQEKWNKEKVVLQERFFNDIKCLGDCYNVS